MTSIFFSLRAQPTCHLFREAFHNHPFPEYLLPRSSYHTLFFYTTLFAMIHVFDYLLGSFTKLSPIWAGAKLLYCPQVYPVPWHSLACESGKSTFVKWMSGINEWMAESMNERHMEEPSWTQVLPSPDVQDFYVLSSLRPWQVRASFNFLCSEPNSPVPSQAAASPSRPFWLAEAPQHQCPTAQAACPSLTGSFKLLT